MTDCCLQSAIDAAHAEITGGLAKTQEAAPIEKEEVTEVAAGEVSEGEEESSEEDSSKSDDLTEAQILESKTLYNALRGPQANAIIAALAAQAGLLPKPGEAPLTKSEKVEARREIQDIVKDALGPEYSFLQDKIGKIFQEVVTQTESQFEAQVAE